MTDAELLNRLLDVIENDIVPLLRGGLAGRPGIALILGTGSHAAGIGPDRRMLTCGGWGRLMDDAGLAQRSHLRERVAGLLRQAEPVLLSVPFDVGDPRRALRVDGQRREVGLMLRTTQHQRIRRQVARFGGQAASEK